MNENALFGRYWEAESPVHRLDPRTKNLGALFLIVAIFSARNVLSLAFIAAFLASVIAIARIPLLQALRSIVPLLFIVVLTGLFNLLFVQGGTIYVDWGWLRISENGIAQASFISMRLLLLLLSGSLLTMTTTSMDITEGIEKLLVPLSSIGVPTHEFAFILGTALRFLPQFSDEFHQIRIAQEARGAKLSTSPLHIGMASVTSLMVPLFASVFRHADTLSDAMEARCYHGAKGRTRLHPLAFRRPDMVAAAVIIAVLAVVLLLNVLLD